MIIKIDFNCSFSHAGDTMNPPSRRSTCENAVNKEQIGSAIVARSKPENSKTPIISYDYEAAISQPDIPVYAKIDNNPQNASWSEASDESASAPTKKRNLHICRKASVTTKKKGIAFKSKIQVKKVTKTRPLICNIAGIKKESIPSTEIIRNIENYGQEISDGIIVNRETPPNLRQVCSNKIFLLDIPILQLICIIFRRICRIPEMFREQQGSQKITGILRTKLLACFKKILIKLIKIRKHVSPEIKSAKFRA